MVIEERVKKSEISAFRQTLCFRRSRRVLFRRNKSSSGSSFRNSLRRSLTADGDAAAPATRRPRQSPAPEIDGLHLAPTRRRQQRLQPRPPRELLRRRGEAATLPQRVHSWLPSGGSNWRLGQSIGGAMVQLSRENSKSALTQERPAVRSLLLNVRRIVCRKIVETEKMSKGTYIPLRIPAVLLHGSAGRRPVPFSSNCSRPSRNWAPLSSRPPASSTSATWRFTSGA